MSRRHVAYYCHIDPGYTSINIHREVVRNCKSRDDVGYFLEKCFDSSGAASCDKSTCKVKDIFLAFVNIAICRDDM
jgi:hypothetical protein